MALLACRGLTRRPWFAGLDLALEAGEIVTLSGPTGSGKTLLLRTIADLDPCDEGDVLLRDRPRGEIATPRWRSQVLYLHQSAVRLPGTVGENVARITSLSVHREGDRRPPAPVPGLDPDADAERLSGGEAQALALHRALLCAPDVLLLDEATSALDAQSAAYWEERVRAWVAEGHAALWVAHDETLADRLGARRERFP